MPQHNFLKNKFPKFHEEKKRKKKLIKCVIFRAKLNVQ